VPPPQELATPLSVLRASGFGPYGQSDAHCFPDIVFNEAMKRYIGLTVNLLDCRAMLCISATYVVVRHAVSASSSVCLSVTFVYSVEMNKHLQFRSPSGSHTILVFVARCYA